MVCFNYLKRIYTITGNCCFIYSTGDITPKEKKDTKYLAEDIVCVQIMNSTFQK